MKRFVEAVEEQFKMSYDYGGEKRNETGKRRGASMLLQWGYGKMENLSQNGRSKYQKLKLLSFPRKVGFCDKGPR